MNELLQLLLGVLGTILTGLAAWGISMLTAWVNSKIKDEKMRVVVTNVSMVISAAVATTNQTFVDALKKEGKFDKEAAAKAFKITKEAVMKQLTEDVKKLIEQHYGDVEEYVMTQIEEHVRSSH